MIKGYKATHDYKCLNQTYEIGQEYKLDEKPILCKYGFHYCINAEDTLGYYSFTHEFKLLEIEDLSNDTITEDDKSCSNHIRIIREITDKDELLQLLGQVRTYDENGRILTCENSDGYWKTYTYNENGRISKFEDSNGYWKKYTYDSNGNKLSFENSYGTHYEYTYDENGINLTCKNLSKYPV